MSRKIINNIKRAVVRVVLYLRLSKEDLDKNPEERSESIKNQERLLRDYVAEHPDWEIITVYNDEDYSGADATRPEFNKMIDECEKGNIDLVLAKTQARFARDSELVERYIYNKFLEWGVRFKTVVDRIDNSKKETKKTSQIIGLTDEWTLEDNSENIREILNNKRTNGLFTGSFAPYGYQKDPENKSHLIIDPVAAETVKRIFNDYNSGISLTKITENLIQEDVLSPLEYKKMNGINLKLPFTKEIENYDYISKAGKYIVESEFYNDTGHILNTITTIDLITTKNDITFNDFSIKLVDYVEQKMEIYYSTIPIEQIGIDYKDGSFRCADIDLTSKEQWSTIKKGETFPSNVTCIVTQTKELDRTHAVSYLLEFNLYKNREHKKYFYSSNAFSDNKNLKIKFNSNIRNKHKWSTSTIKKILRDEIYIGNLIQFKTTTVSYKNKKIIYNEKDEQIRKNNTHEPIIDNETWYKAQSKISNKTKSCKDGKIHVLARKVYCANCGSIFYKCGSDGYLCCKDKKNKWVNCDNCKFLRESELHEFIVDKINDLLKQFYDGKILEKNYEQQVNNELFKTKIESLKQEQAKIDRELKNKTSYFQNLYEDRKNGFIDDEEYLLLKSKYKNDNEKLKNRAEIISQELKNVELQKIKLKDKKTLFGKYTNINNLDINIVNDFIDKIEIGKYSEESNERDIKITWNFVI